MLNSFLPECAKAPLLGTEQVLSSRPIQARIDGTALRNNYQIAHRRVGASRLWCVVKANAYGHGILRAAQALAPLADGFALIEIENAVALRAAGIRQPILLLEGFYADADIALLAAHDLTPALHSLAQIERFVALAAPTDVYVKLNTGMNRLGLDADELPRALALLEASGKARSITLMTHFADADGDSGIAEQWQRLQAMRGGLERDYPLCAANSATLLRHPQAHGAWVRPGIMLYGSSPFPHWETAAQLGLRPAMTLQSELLAVRTLKAGEGVGYGFTFRTDRDRRIGVVACGYADGYPRHAPTGTPVLVDGVRTRLLGRVSMDKLCVDLEAVPNARVGSIVTLWGAYADSILPADEVAAAAGTVAYELFCALAPRVPVVEVGAEAGDGQG